MVRQFFFKIYKKMPIIISDSLLIPVAWYCAYWLRYNMKPFPPDVIASNSISALSLLMIIQIGCYYHFKVYRGLWYFSSLNDVIRIIKAILTAILLTIPILYLTSLLNHIPRSVLPLYGLVLSTLLCIGRLMMRLYRDSQNIDNPNSMQVIQRVLIIGAGQAAESLVRDLKRTQSYLPVGFVDDDPSKCGMDIHGVRVLGAINDLLDITRVTPVNLIFIAIPSARSAAMRRIVGLCEACQVPFRTLPSLNALASGLVQVHALRNVNIDDLLGRDQVQLDWQRIAENIQDKKIVITGGGGSIGSELCRQIVKLKPKLLTVIDNSEFNLYKIEQELTEIFPTITLDFLLVSVTDAVAINYHFNRIRPNLVFHAAAFKHVPLLEDQIRAAVLNNILGTQVVAQASATSYVDTFILISTDKAVNPTNIMGATKRVAELYCQNFNEHVTTQFMTVRFGNVLGSAGSVVPLFHKQLQLGGPLTVTHPDMERYFMTIPEACELILQATVNGCGSEIFVLDMGKPIKIRYLAEQMIRLAGKEPGKDIEIRYVGLRPGEKLFEELFHESEHLTKTAHEKLFKACFRQLDWQLLIKNINLLTIACDNHQNEKIYALIKGLVPEFKSPLDVVDDHSKQLDEH
jgi:FlaA1/EpsC-like NDP-sugar epimerase